ncbi:MAG: GNAT family N-acetyltransferase, partial [Urechidicola sp.]|nr:GNAT family N-acetyltransferase [Urechidicola sp.]
MILETERLYLRKMTLEDAPFILQLVNDPSWLEYIGDKNVNSLKDAKQYIKDKILKQYEIHGFGFYLVSTKNEKLSVGLTG